MVARLAPGPAQTLLGTSALASINTTVIPAAFVAASYAWLLGLCITRDAHIIIITRDALDTTSAAHLRRCTVLIVEELM
jgi:hypothetical protein